MSLLLMRKLCLFPVLVVFVALFSRVILAQSPSAPKPVARNRARRSNFGQDPFRADRREQGVPDSKPLANAEFVVTKENSTVASFQTDDQGRFQISLPPGHYTISRKDWSGSIGSYGPFEVDIAAGQRKRVEWSCDTGIR